MPDEKSPQIQTEPTDVIKGKDLDPTRPYFGMPIPAGKIDAPSSADSGKEKVGK